MKRIKLSVAGLAALVLAPAAIAADPPVVIELNGRTSKAVPVRQCCTHLGGGNITVTQPSADQLVITMTGVAVAGHVPGCASMAGFDFDLEQCFDVVINDPKVKRAKITMEGRLVGLLRSHGGKCSNKCNSAEVSQAAASLNCVGADLVAITMPAHSVSCGEHLSINDHQGPCSAPILPGKYSVHQCFKIAAQVPKSLLPCKAPSSEFAPESALDPLWISYWEPFHGAKKDEFGFQVTVKVAADDANGNADPAPVKVTPAPANGQ